MKSPEMLLSKLARKKLLVKSRRRGFHKGLRRANTFGSSLEFSDFRAYQSGDDVRQIDWNIYGRTQKHYIKRFLDEQEISVSIYLDCTSSMRAINDKWLYAKQLAALLSFIVLKNEDRLQFVPVSAAQIKPIRRKGALYSKGVFSEIIKLQEEGASDAFAHTLSQQLTKMSTLSVLITDGLEEVDKLENLFKKLKALKQEIWLLQVLSHEEIIPPYTSDMRLIDSETNSTVNVSMNKRMYEQYQIRLTEHNRKLEMLCQRYGGHYVLIRDDSSLESVLLQTFPQKGLMG